MSPSPLLPAWVPVVLRCAAVYNIVWGVFVILFPRVPFQWLGLEPPNYPSILQCLGMVIGVYGVGYWIAARDAVTHWPIVLVGLLGKVFGPIGFIYAAGIGELPWRMGVVLLTNDIAWWLPFTAILVHSARIYELQRAGVESSSLEQALRSAVTAQGTNLFDLSFQSPELIVCVRHQGCTFCREALADLASQRPEIDRLGLTPVVVTMSTDEQASQIMSRYGLNGVTHVSDPERRLYRALEVPFGSLNQVFNSKAMWRAVVEGTVFRFGFGRVVGNALQLSGAFVVKNGTVVRAFRSSSSSDRTDFAQLTCDIVG